MIFNLNGVKARGETLRRLSRIANVLFRNGFEVFVEKTPLAALVAPDCRAEVEEACRCEEEKEFCPCGHALPLPQRVLDAVVDLGPTFIKFAQVASTRPDLIPPEFSEPLRRLQEHVRPFPLDQVRQIVEVELGKPLDEIFRSFEDSPIASASLSQVHFAELPDGTPVAVKVQRPGIQAIIEQDLTILRWLARQIARVAPGVRNLRPEAAVEEFGRWTLRELDFRLEGKNLDEFRRNFAGSTDVHFPKVYWDYTSPRLLTMERVSGLRVHQVVKNLQPHERKQAARRLAEVELQMFITDAFFHADLHPGNIFFQEDGTIVILDVGMVGRMSPELRDRFLSYWIAIIRQQRQRAFHHLLKMALSKENANLLAFEARYNAILDQFYGAPLAKCSLAQTYLEILLAGAEFNLIFPSEMILQAKAIVTTEALDLVLDPTFQFTEEARPIVARALAERASPDRLFDRIWSTLADFILLGEIAPSSPTSSQKKPDERRFRHEALRSLAAVWVDWMDDRLLQHQTDVDRFASFEFWQQHPEWHALFETAAGLLRLFSLQLEQLFWASEPDDPWPKTPSLEWQVNGGNGSKKSPVNQTGDERYQKFRQGFIEQNGKARSFTKELNQAAVYVEGEVKDLAESEYWDDRQILRAGLKSGFTMLRLFNMQLEQAIRESLDEKDAEDPSKSTQT
jgi:predicted unusual protein kinase regulating ubiquinone biosynthesis (AarF/ABC1/UbiB family)